MKPLLVFVIVMMISGITRAELIVSDGWVTKPIATVTNVAGYMRLSNTGADDVQVVAAHCEFAKHCQLHTIIHDGGVVRMRHVPEVLVAAGATVKLEPGGLHLMVMGITDEFQKAALLPVQLELSSGSRVKVDLPIKDNPHSKMPH